MLSQVRRYLGWRWEYGYIGGSKKSLKRGELLPSIDRTRGEMNNKERECICVHPRKNANLQSEKEQRRRGFIVR